MRTFVLAALLSFAAGCHRAPPACADVVDHVLGLQPPELRAGRDVGESRAFCEQHLDGEARHCMLRATSVVAAYACRK